MKNNNSNSKRRMRAFAAFTACICFCGTTGNALLMNKNSGSVFGISALTVDAADTKSDITTMFADFATSDVKCSIRQNEVLTDIEITTEQKTTLIKTFSAFDWSEAQTDKSDFDSTVPEFMFSVNGSQFEVFENDYCDFYDGKTNGDTFYYVKGIYEAASNVIGYNDPYFALSALKNEFISGEVECELTENGKTTKIDLTTEQKNDIFSALISSISASDFDNIKTADFKHDSKAGKIILSLKGEQIEIYEEDYVNSFNASLNADTQYKIDGVYKAVYAAINGEVKTDLSTMLADFITGKVECAVSRNGIITDIEITADQKTNLIRSLSAFDWSEAQTDKYDFDSTVPEFMFSVNGSQFEIFENDYCDFFDGKTNGDTFYYVNGIYDAVSAVIKVSDAKTDLSTMLADFITGKVECTLNTNGSSETIVLSAENKAAVLKALSAYNWKNSETTEYKHDSKAGKITFSVNGNEFEICEEDCCNFFDGKLNADTQYKVNGIYKTVYATVKDLFGGKGDVTITTTKTPVTTTTTTKKPVTTTTKPITTTTKPATTTTAVTTTPVTTTTETKSLGDVDGNNTVDASDASAVLAAYAAVQTGGTSQLSDSQKKAADVDGNGIVDASDASTILAYYAYRQTGGEQTFADYLNG